MANKKKNKKPLKPKKEESFDSDILDETKTISVERTLEELLFVNVDYTDIKKLKKLRRINRRKHIDIIKKLKDCLKEAI